MDDNENIYKSVFESETKELDEGLKNLERTRDLLKEISELQERLNTIKLEWRQKDFRGNGEDIYCYA